MWNLLGKIGMLMTTNTVKIYDSSKAVGDQWGGSYAWLNTLFSVLNPVLYAIMAIVGAAGAIYAIVLGVNLARAESQDKREEAKKRLITTLIAVGVTIALVVFFTTLFPMILGSFMGEVQVEDTTVG